jgi:hypothetical protein
MSLESGIIDAKLDEDKVRVGLYMEWEAVGIVI